MLESFARLKAEADLVLVEGAGSAAEINLRADDIANMGFARAADVPVVLVGDIDRGGVIAQIVGTQGGARARGCGDDRGLHRQQVSRRPEPVPSGMAALEGHTGWRASASFPSFPTPGACRPRTLSALAPRQREASAAA